MHAARSRMHAALSRMRAALKRMHAARSGMHVAPMLKNSPGNKTKTPQDRHKCRSSGASRFSLIRSYKHFAPSGAISRRILDLDFGFWIERNETIDRPQELIDGFE